MRLDDEDVDVGDVEVGRDGRTEREGARGVEVVVRFDDGRPLDEQLGGREGVDDPRAVSRVGLGRRADGLRGGRGERVLDLGGRRTAGRDRVVAGRGDEERAHPADVRGRHTRALEFGVVAARLRAENRLPGSGHPRDDVLFGPVAGGVPPAGAGGDYLARRETGDPVVRVGRADAESLVDVPGRPARAGARVADGGDDEHASRLGVPHLDEVAGPVPEAAEAQRYDVGSLEHGPLHPGVLLGCGSRDVDGGASIVVDGDVEDAPVKQRHARRDTDGRPARGTTRDRPAHVGPVTVPEIGVVGLRAGDPEPRRVELRPPAGVGRVGRVGRVEVDVRMAGVDTGVQNGDDDALAGRPVLVPDRGGVHPFDAPRGLGRGSDHLQVGGGLGRVGAPHCVDAHRPGPVDGH